MKEEYEVDDEDILKIIERIDKLYDEISEENE